MLMTTEGPVFGGQASDIIRWSKPPGDPETFPKTFPDSEPAYAAGITPGNRSISLHICVDYSTSDAELDELVDLSVRAMKKIKRKFNHEI